MPRLTCLAALAVVVVTTGCASQTLVIPVSTASGALAAARPGGAVRSYDSALRVVAAILVGELELPLPHQLTVFVYPTRLAYADGLASAGRMSRSRAQEIAAYSVGLGQHRQLFINDEALRGACRRAWLGVVAHELTHSAQYELSGGRRGRSEQWLREGMADWVAARVLERLGVSTFRHEHERAMRDVARAWPARDDVRIGLVTIGDPRGWEAGHLRSGGSLAYRLAFLLADELIRGRGWGRVIDYFRAFATSDDRFNHFQTAFGTSVDEFEVDGLGRIRRELGGRDRDWTPLEARPDRVDPALEARMLDRVDPCDGAFDE